MKLQFSLGRFVRPKILHIRYLFSVALLSQGLFASDSPPLAIEAFQLGGQDIVGPFVSEALVNNRGLVAHERRYEAARQSIISAGALPNPKVQLINWIESIQTRTGPQRQVFMLQQPIPWLAKLDGRRDVAMAQANSLWQAFALQQFQLVDQVSQQTLEIAYLDKSIEKTNQNLDLLRRLEPVVEDRVKTGAELGDLLKLKIEIQRIEDEVARRETQRIEAAEHLGSLLGRSSISDFRTLEWDAPDDLVGEAQQWLTAIQDQSPQLFLLKTLETSQVARERLVALAKRPDFDVGINYIRTGDAINPGTAGSGKDPWALMVGISLPVWRKGDNAAKLQASLEKEAIAAQVAELELQLVSEGRAWITKLEDSQKRIQRYDTELLPLARQSFEITQSSYQSGKASILDLIDAERSLLKLETEYWRAAADAWRARWKLATLSGGLWID